MEKLKVVKLGLKFTPSVVEGMLPATKTVSASGGSLLRYQEAFIFYYNPNKRAIIFQLDQMELKMPSKTHLPMLFLGEVKPQMDIKSTDKLPTYF